LCLGFVGAGLGASPDEAGIFRIDADHSKLEIHVGTAGFFKAFGHDHLISAKRFSGQARFSERSIENSSVTFTVETKSLEVLDPGESEKDRAEVQATMLGDTVLNSMQFPEIKFTSSGVRVVRTGSDGIEAKLEGKLSLHGVEKPVTVPVRIRISGDKLTATGEVELRQSDYGITPIKVGGGAVRVKDELKIQFEIVATK
jgi:polyisoprenoid-binding protein YceI